MLLGQEWDLRRPDQIEECLRHSDTVYNLVGRDYETKYVNPPLPSPLRNSALTMRLCVQELHL